MFKWLFSKIDSLHPDLQFFFWSSFRTFSGKRKEEVWH